VRSNTAARAWNSSAWSNRLSVVGAGYDGFKTGQYIAAGDYENALFSATNAVVDVGAVALGPAGAFVAIGQAGINVGMTIYSDVKAIQGYMGDVKSASIAQNVLRQANDQATALKQQMQDEGCN